MKLDLHTHILPSKLPNWSQKFQYSGFIQLHECPGCADLDMISDEGKFFRRIDPRCFDADHRIQDMQKLQVDQQVLSTLPVMFSYWTPAEHGLQIAQFLNDHLAEVRQKHPQQFYGLGTVPMQDTDLAVRELQRCKQLGLHGVQIGSNINGMNLSETRFHAFWQACEQLNMSVFVHPWNMMGQDRMTQYWLPWLVGMPAESSLAICSMIFGGVFEKYPKLRVAFAHGGGSFPFTLGRIEHGFQCRPDLVAVDNPRSPSSYIGKFFVDSLVHDLRSLRFLLEMFGPDKICLGSDYPFPLGEDEPGRLIQQLQNPAISQKLCYQNSRAFLGFEK